jgi:hypothetical protein
MSVLDVLGGLADLTGCVVLRLGLLVDIASPLFLRRKRVVCDGPTIDRQADPGPILLKRRSAQNETSAADATNHGGLVGPVDLAAQSAHMNIDQVRLGNL